VRLLLDSQALLFWMVAPDRFPQAVGDAIDSPRNRVAVSAASFWELSIKQAKGKLALPRDDFARVFAADFQLLSITPEHGIAAARLPPHHGDPFDRLLIAQAQTEGLTLVGANGVFGEYDVDVLWG